MPVPISKVSVGDYVSNSVNGQKETTSNNVVTAVSAVLNNASQNQKVKATITTALGTFVTLDENIILSGKNGQGISMWVVGD